MAIVEDNDIVLKKMSQAVEDAMIAFSNECDRAEELANELDKEKAEQDEYMVKHAQGWLARDALQVEFNALKYTFGRECERLGWYRDTCIARERIIKDGIVMGCQHIFNKVKDYFCDQAKVDRIKNLYRQVKRTREALEHLKTV